MIPTDSSAQSGRWNGYLPDANEINGYIAAERRFKPPSKGIVGRLIDLVREGNLLHVISGEQANLPDQPSWYHLVSKTDGLWGSKPYLVQHSSDRPGSVGAARETCHSNRYR